MKKRYVESRVRLRWLFRVAAVVLGLLPLLVAEITLRALHLPKSAPAIDPFVDLHHLHPLFELDWATGEYRIAAERMNLFRPAKFSRSKSQNAFRIFCLGGSTTQGEPYSTETAFGHWMQLNLQAANPAMRFEVINCGGLSYASYRVRAILHEVLQYQPDLIVIYTGQNEFLERRTYLPWLEQSPTSGSFRGWLGNLRIARMARRLVQGPADRAAALGGERTVLAGEVDALLDYKGGLDQYRRGDSWRDGVERHFRWNLERMVEDCQAAGVPLILMRPVVNLLDCPPFKFEVDPRLDRARQAEFDAAWQVAQSSGDATVAIAALRRGLEIDPGHAGAWYYLGQLQYSAGQWVEAAESLRQANDHDVCPLRALTSIQNAVQEIARSKGVPIVDAERLFSERSDHGIVGKKWLVDHVHPTIEGHQLLGEALCEVCLEKSWCVAESPNWQTQRTEIYRRHLRDLGEVYFQRGKQRLEGLQLWTQGRSKKIRPDADSSDKK